MCRAAHILIGRYVDWVIRKQTPIEGKSRSRRDLALGNVECVAEPDPLTLRDLRPEARGVVNVNMNRSVR
jgi:hypothetical protein